MKRLILPILLATIHAGCYRYAPASVDDLATGDELRARLSVAETDRIRDHVPDERRTLEGRFVGHVEDRILLDVPVLSQARGSRLETIHQRIDVAAAGIVELEIRQLDRLRTALVTAAGIAVVGAIVLPRFVGGGSPDGNGETEPLPEDPRPIGVRVPLPW